MKVVRPSSELLDKIAKATRRWTRRQEFLYVLESNQQEINARAKQEKERLRTTN